MQQPIRQRLVGAGVILALSIILLSWIYEPEYARSEAKSLPVAPEMPTVPVFVEEEHKLTDRIDELAETDRLYHMPEPVGPSATIAKPQLDSRGVPQTWSLQMGVFANRDNASALVKQLQKMGYKAYSRHWNKTGGKTMDGVYVGPMVDQKDLLKLRDELSQKVKLKGVLVRYHP